MPCKVQSCMLFLRAVAEREATKERHWLSAGQLSEERDLAGPAPCFERETGAPAVETTGLPRSIRGCFAVG